MYCCVAWYDSAGNRVPVFPPKCAETYSQAESEARRYFGGQPVAIVEASSQEDAGRQGGAPPPDIQPQPELQPLDWTPPPPGLPEPAPPVFLAPVDNSPPATAPGGPGPREAFDAYGLPIDPVTREPIWVPGDIRPGAPGGPGPREAFAPVDNSPPPATAPGGPGPREAFAPVDSSPPPFTAPGGPGERTASSRVGVGLQGDGDFDYSIYSTDELQNLCFRYADTRACALYFERMGPVYPPLRPPTPTVTDPDPMADPATTDTTKTTPTGTWEDLVKNPSDVIKFVGGLADIFDSGGKSTAPSSTADPKPSDKPVPWYKSVPWYLWGLLAFVVGYLVLRRR